MRALRLLAAITIPLLLIVGALYLFAGLRIELSGGGMPNLVFRADHDEQAELIARHRAAQRAASPDRPAVTVPVPVQPDTPARPEASRLRPQPPRRQPGHGRHEHRRTGRTSGGLGATAITASGRSSRAGPPAV